MNDLKPRFAEYPPTVLAGLAGRYTRQTKSQIPVLWQRFVPYIGKIPGQIGATTFGYCSTYRSDGSFEYLCAVQIDRSGILPLELKTVEIPQRTYAVFARAGHISGIAATWAAIFSQWMPSWGCTLEEEPNFEVYPALFDPMSVVEIWIPLKAGSTA